MIVSIEGMDGVGKTTVAKSIEKNWGFIYVKDPLKELLEISQEHLSRISDKIFNYDDEKIKAWFLALGDIYAISKYKNNDVIMDRHILLNYFWNGTDKSETIFKNEVDLFGKPDLTIVLMAYPETRIKRIKERNPNDSDLKKDNMKIYGYDKIISFLDKYNYNYTIVDTENLTIEQTIEKCNKIINNLKKTIL